MRVLGVDFGVRRIGLAVSDPTASLARPWRTLGAGDSPVASAAIVADLITSLGRADDDDVADLQAVVVGVPRKLGGEPTDQTAAARLFAQALGAMTGLAVHEQDERLSSHEADALLKVKERDWRRRKDKLDAAAAAVILQDYLDARPRTASADAEPPVA
jgi:putative Holliday junction resolvase